MIINGVHVNNQAVPYRGVISEINDTSIYIELTARLGVLVLPKRWLISENAPKVGDRVKLLMSYVEMEDNNYEKEETDVL